MEGKEVYLKEDIVWAFETFIRQLKSSEAIHPQTIRVVERLKSQIVEIVPTHEVGSPWHTGTPTEEGRYLLECGIGNSENTYFTTDYWNNEVGYWTVNRVIRWQKIKED